MTRRAILGGALAAALAGAREAVAAPPRPAMTVHKSPTCGCCVEWVEHMRKNGYAVTTVDAADLAPLKKKLGVPAELQSCHTATVDRYVIEGHVPADLVDRLLRERPPVLGLAVPGMPIGSPGMEVPGRAAERYQIVAFDREGRRLVYDTR